MKNLKQKETRERRPQKGLWERIGHTLETSPGELIRTGWVNMPIAVLSSLVIAKLPGQDKSGLTWHISATQTVSPGLAGKARCTDAQMQYVRECFGMLDAEEDNHHPGDARHLFMPVDPQYRTGCDCKDSEVTITEPDGYQWQNPKEGACRGCELSVIMGRDCPIHGPDKALVRAGMEDYAL